MDYSPITFSGKISSIPYVCKRIFSHSSTNETLVFKGELPINPTFSLRMDSIERANRSIQRKLRNRENIEDETIPILRDLINMNALGFTTVESQPFIIKENHYGILEGKMKYPTYSVQSPFVNGFMAKDAVLLFLENL